MPLDPYLFLDLQEKYEACTNIKDNFTQNESLLLILSLTKCVIQIPELIKPAR